MPEKPIPPPPDDESEPTLPQSPHVRCPICSGNPAAPGYCCFFCLGKYTVTRDAFAAWHRNRYGR